MLPSLIYKGHKFSQTLVDGIPTGTISEAEIETNGKRPAGVTV